MPEHLIRVTQTQLLADSSDIVLHAPAPEAAAQVVLDTVAGDPDDETDTDATACRTGATSSSTRKTPLLAAKPMPRSSWMAGWSRRSAARSR